MPLQTDCTTEGRRRLMHKLLHEEGRPQKQAVAIMLSVERRAGCQGASKAPSKASSKAPKKGVKKGVKKPAPKRRAGLGRSVGHVSIQEVSVWVNHTPLATIDALLPPRTPPSVRADLLEKVQSSRAGLRVRLTVDELRILSRARLNEMTGMARGSFAVRFEHGAGHRGTVFVEAKSKRAAAKKAKKQLDDIEVVKVKRAEPPSRAALYPVSAEFRAREPSGHAAGRRATGHKAGCACSPACRCGAKCRCRTGRRCGPGCRCATRKPGAAFGHSPPLAERPHYTAKATRAHRGAVWEIRPVEGGYGVFHRNFGRGNYLPMHNTAFSTRREAEAWMLKHFPAVKAVVGQPT